MVFYGSFNGATILRSWKFIIITTIVITMKKKLQQDHSHSVVDIYNKNQLSDFYDEKDSIGLQPFQR